MTTTITVQGSHTAWVEPEQGTLHVSAAFDGPQRDEVFARATAAAAEVTGRIEPLAQGEGAAVVRWSSDRVNVWTERPWNADGARLPLVHHATIAVRATFRDVDALSRVIEQLAVQDGVTLGAIAWDLTDERRAEVTDEVRRAAVADAVAKAGVYASAAEVSAPVVAAIADPGMLGDGGTTAAPAGMERMAFRAQAADAGGAPLTLTPDRIAVSASVDVRFTAG